MVENEGVEPDILIDNDPVKEWNGEDEQLNRAIEEAFVITAILLLVILFISVNTGTLKVGIKELLWMYWKLFGEWKYNMKAVIITIAGISSIFNEEIPKEQRKLKATYYEDEAKKTFRPMIFSFV